MFMVTITPYYKSAKIYHLSPENFHLHIVHKNSLFIGVLIKTINTTL